MKNILISSTIPQRFLDQINFAKNLHKHTEEFRIYFFISDDVYSVHKDVADKLNFKIINKPKKNNLSDPKHKINNLIKEKVKSFLSINQANMIRRCIAGFNNSLLFTNRFRKEEKTMLLHLKSSYEVISKLVKKYNIEALLINGDRHLGLEPVFLKISQRLKIPSIIVYLVDYADEERIFYNNFPTKKIKPNLFTSKYIIKSQDRLSYKITRDSYYYPHYVANALNKFNVLTKNPYVMGCGSSDILCLNNYHYKNLYIRHGVDEKKIRVVGDGIYDHIYKQYLNKNSIRQDMMKKYCLDKDKKNIIIALPQLGEHGELPWDRHWKEINFLIETLESLNHNTLISLHPKMNEKEYKFLEKKYNCKILSERLFDVIPSADLFVATYSSTIIWSILCGVKTVVVDFYEFNYSMFDFLKSIRKVEEKNKLKSTLNNILIENIDFHEDWKILSKDDVFDGKTMQRYTDLINEKRCSY